MGCLTLSWKGGRNCPTAGSSCRLSTSIRLFAEEGTALACRLCDADNLDCPESLELDRCEPSLDCPFLTGLAPCPEEPPPPGPVAGAPVQGSSGAVAASVGAEADSGGSSPVGAIVGSVLGGLAAAAALTALLLVRGRRRRRRKRELPFYSDSVRR